MSALAACKTAPPALVATPIAVSATPAAPSAGMAAPGASPPAADDAFYSTVDRTRIDLTAIQNGSLGVSARPGAVTGGGVTLVNVAVIHDLLPSWRTLLHAGSTFQIASASLALNPDGGFQAVSLGDRTRPVQAGDKLYINPMKDATTASGQPGIVIIH